MWPNRPTPDVIGWGANRSAGSGSAATGWSKNPTETSHSSVSVPRVRRRTRGTRLVDRWTVRPAVEQVLRDLAARLGRADDEDGAGGELGGVPVRDRVQLLDPVGQVGGQRRRARLALGPRRHDDAARGDRLRVRAAEADLERAVGARLEARHLGPGPHRELGRPCMVVQVGDPRVARHEAVGRAGGRAAGQAAHPGRRVQGERVPALGPPRLADPAALQDDVAHAAPPQVPARGQPRGARPHDDRVFHRCPHLQGRIVPGPRRKAVRAGRRVGRRVSAGRRPPAASRSGRRPREGARAAPRRAAGARGGRRRAPRSGRSPPPARPRFRDRGDPRPGRPGRRGAGRASPRLSTIATISARRYVSRWTSPRCLPTAAHQWWSRTCVSCVSDWPSRYISLTTTWPPGRSTRSISARTGAGSAK